MSQSYRGQSVFGTLHTGKFVDLNGRIVTVVEDDDSGELFVSLTELKRSGFELFEAGTFPNPGGYLKCMTELQINQFEMYMRMKAAKYLSRTVLEIGKGNVDDIIYEQKEYFKLGQNPNRTVNYNSKGNFSITTKVEPPTKVSNNNLERNGNKMSYNNRDNSNPNRQPQLQYERSNNYRSNTERNNTSSYRKSSHENVVSPSNSRTSSTRNEERRSFQPKVDYPNNSNSNLKSLLEVVVSPPLSSSSSTRSEERKSFQPKVNYSNNSNSNRKSLHHEDVISPTNSRSSFTENEKRKSFQPKEDYSNTKQPRLNPSIYLKPEPMSDKLPSKPENSSPLSPVPPSEKMQNNQQKRVSNADFGNSSSVVSSTPIVSPVTIIEPKEQAKPFTRKCMVDMVSQGGMLEYLSTVDDTTIVAYVVPLNYTSEFAMLSDIAEECPINLNFAPVLGDMIAVFYDKEDTYVRGIVNNIVNSNYTCSLIDFGELVTTTNIRPLIKKFIEIPEFACYITGSAEDIKEIKKDGNIINVEITSPGNLTLEIEQTKKNYNVQAKIWNPLNIVGLPKPKLTENIKPTQVVFKVAEDKNHLNSGDTVIINSTMNNFLVVRTRQCDILFKQIPLVMEKTHQIDYYMEAPVVNELVLCPTSNLDDDGLYRAEVLSVDGEFVNVRYVDYGNFDSVPISTCQYINETLANISNTYIMITLKDFGNKIFTTKQISVLIDCFYDRTKLTAVGTDDPQVFDLLFPDKTSLSKTLIDLEKPPAPLVYPRASRKPSSTSSTEEKKYKVEDMPDCVLKTGLNKAMCVHTEELSEGGVTFCPVAEDTTGNLLLITELIAEHIAKDSKPYQPDLLELCIAKYEEEWHRGTVLGLEDGNVEVYFNDYGNSSTMRCENIRRISQKLAAYPACSAACVLKDIVKDDSAKIQEPVLSKLETHIIQFEIYDIDVIEKIDGSYYITIPSVYKSLKEEGVL